MAETIVLNFPCEACNGTGMSELNEVPSGFFVSLVAKTCPSCNGGNVKTEKFAKLSTLQ